MAFSLLDANKLSNDDVQRGVVEVIYDSPLLNRLPFAVTDGAAYVLNQEATLGTAGFRAFNGSFTESTGTLARKTFNLAYLGIDSDVDKAAVTHLSNINDQRAVTLAMSAKAVRLKFVDTLINGDGTSNTFVGVDSQIDGTAQELSTGTNGAAINTDSTTRQAFFDKVADLIAAVDGGADALIMNSQVLAKFRSAARRESLYSETRDDFGRNIVTFDGVVLIDAGSNGTAPIIAQDEVQGTSSDASSIYAVRFGLDGVHGVQSSQGLRVSDIGELQTKPSYRYRIDWDVAVAVAHPKAAAVLRGVRAA